VRRYSSILNFLDSFKTIAGIIKAVFQLFSLYPDVVFSKGGYASVPTVYAARILGIPVVIHESDAKPGRANLWAAKFARAIAIAHPLAAEKFPKKVRDKIALVGNPIRRQIEVPAKEGGYEFLKLDPSAPVIFITGGSLGSEAINDVIIDALPLLVEKYNIVHQTGRTHIETVQAVAKMKLADTRYENRYRAFGLLNELAMRMLYGVASLIISRAGSGTIFEIAAAAKPAILIPIPEQVSHDQTSNAFSYAREGAAVVMEQNNLTPNLLVAEIGRIMSDPDLQKRMSEAARAYARPDAAQVIADHIIEIALEHA
jgi:UDP-N-acetylglucosamine--N-acetylmuramyl-(pentapeptide) pyrophosphoryl-undecaprenol N-acetylglucosamine transferase